MSESDDYEWVNGFLSLMRGLHQDRVIANAEVSLKKIPDVHVVAPGPNDSHPAFSHSADFIRRFDQDYVRIPSIARSATIYVTPETEAPESLGIRTAVLQRKKVWAPAPYVGDPNTNQAVYIWSCWVDDYGRYVTGDAKLTWRY